MLRTRILTALCLAALVLLVLLFGSLTAFVTMLVMFFACASWEIFRLFENRYPIPYAFASALFFAIFVCLARQSVYTGLAFFSVVVWLLFFAPSMRKPLPQKHSRGDRFFERFYFISVFTAFLAVLSLYRHSLVLLLSVLILVNIADIGAYFAGRTFGKHKLAPEISPGKTWEGVAGGLLFVVLLSVAAVFVPGLENSIMVRIHGAYGWAAMIFSMVVLVGMSVLGDLLESRLKRRRGFKDSSNLLPGHGGILDRIDSLIPVLPLAALMHMWV
jgi:phosphatidate cytidylyltransferase